MEISVFCASAWVNRTFPEPDFPLCRPDHRHRLQKIAYAKAMCIVFACAGVPGGDWGRNALRATRITQLIELWFAHDAVRALNQPLETRANTSIQTGARTGMNAEGQAERKKSSFGPGALPPFWHNASGLRAPRQHSMAPVRMAGLRRHTRAVHNDRRNVAQRPGEAQRSGANRCHQLHEAAAPRGSSAARRCMQPLNAP